METLLKENLSERAIYFEQAAARSDNIKEAIIFEKDFWVCWTLNEIYSIPELAPHITFKGGTSLSKCYNIIERFSEDIDLTISKHYIGMTDESDPAKAVSKSRRGKLVKKFKKKVEDKIINNIYPLLYARIKKSLSPYHNESEWRLELDSEDKLNTNLFFHYPCSVGAQENDYIESVIKLEFGARGDINPCEEKIIASYINSAFPDILHSPHKIKVSSLLAKRTCWEKIMLLHGEHYRPLEKPPKKRTFRHYYDLLMLDKNNVVDDAMQDIKLFNDVRKNCEIYFPATWVDYNAVDIGALRLFPNKNFIATLKRDCEDMTDMFFGDKPSFDAVMERISEIESKINRTRL